STFRRTFAWFQKWAGSITIPTHFLRTVMLSMSRFSRNLDLQWTSLAGFSYLVYDSCIFGRPRMKTAFFLSGLSLTLILIVICACSRQQQYGVVATPVEEEGIDILFRGFVTGEEEPFAQCHASTIARTRDGAFVVAWFAGTHERHDDVGIWISKGTPDYWSVPVEIAKIRQHPHWNPVLFNTPGGRLILF